MDTKRLVYCQTKKEERKIEGRKERREGGKERERKKGSKKIHEINH